MVGNLIINNTADSFGAGLNAEAYTLVEANTVVGNYNYNSFVHGAGIRGGGGAIIRRNLVVHNGGSSFSGAGITCGSGEMYCNDSWGNAYANYLVGAECDTTGLRNSSFDPQL